MSGRRRRIRWPPRRRREVAAGRRSNARAMPRRSHSVRRLARLDANPAAVRRRSGGADQRLRPAADARQAGRRRKPSGSSAVAHDLQGLRRQDAQRDLSLADRARRHGSRLCVAPARAVDDGAVAAWAVHALRSVARTRQHPVPCAAAVARQVRRSAAHVSGLHDQRVQSAADEPRLCAAALARSGRRAGDQAELSGDG